MSTILGQELDGAFCGPIYYEPFIPKFGETSAFSLITTFLEFLILLFLLALILRKKYYIFRGLNDKARSLLLPFYDRVLYYYFTITLIRMIFYLIQYIYEKVTITSIQDGNTGRVAWFIIIFDTIGTVGIIALEIFILFLLMQTSAGTKAYKRAFRGTIIIIIIEICVILLKHFGAEYHNDYIFFCLTQIFEELILLTIFISVFIYCYFYQIVKNRKRVRNKILYWYILCLCIMFIIMICAYIMVAIKIDGYCLDIIDQYLFHLIFPFIAFITIRSDSEFWRMLLLSWQTSSTVIKGEDDGNGGNKDNIWNKIQMIFGSRSHASGKNSFMDPLVDVLSLGVKMVDFTELQETSDPIAMGSTATVSKAKLAGEEVAIKVFIFDELSIEVVSEFFRESLLISDLHHQNIVEFKGACLRPPELCLVYEFCSCGDLTHLLLTQYFHSNFIHDEHKEKDDGDKPDPKLFVHRLKMLIDVSRGMTRLHDSGIIHRDLKTSNVLVHYDKHRRKYIAKVCDFGSARKIVSPTGAIFGDNSQFANAKTTASTYQPPSNIIHSKSTSDVNSNDPENNKKYLIKAVKSKIKNNKNKNKNVKKHEIIVEDKKNKNKNDMVPNHYRLTSNSMDFDHNHRHNDQKVDIGSDIDDDKPQGKHKRAKTVNITKAIFGRKNKNKQQQQKITVPNKNHNIIVPVPDLSNSSMDYKEEEEEDDEKAYIRGKHKGSTNYDDVEEEEKYLQPDKITDRGPAPGPGPDKNKHKSSYGSIDDTKTAIFTDTTSEMGNVNKYKIAVNHNRDPTQLVFDAPPIYLTTQVGTLAFMAPEILSHVNIAGLSGGWANDKDKDKSKSKSKKSKKKDKKKIEKLQIPGVISSKPKRIVSKSKHARNRSHDNVPLPPPPSPVLHPSGGQQNKNKYNKYNKNGKNSMKTIEHHLSTYTSSTDQTGISSNNKQSMDQQSGTVVIKINTQQNAGQNPRQSAAYYNNQLTNPKQQNNIISHSVPTDVELGDMNDMNDNSDGDDDNNLMSSDEYKIQYKPAHKFNDNNGSKPQSPTVQQKRFSRQYIRKHRQLSMHKHDISDTVPKKPLPPPPIPGTGLFSTRNGASSSIQSAARSFKRGIGAMVFGNSQYYDKPTPDIWYKQNRKNYYYNQPYQQSYAVQLKNSHPSNNNLNLPSLPGSSYGNNNNNLNQSSYPNNPQNNNNNTVYISHNSNNNNNNHHHYTVDPSYKLPHYPIKNGQNNNKNNDIGRFSQSTAASRSNFKKFSVPKNQHQYRNRPLPPDPPKKKKKAQYYARGRTQSRFSTRSRRNSNYQKSIMDDAVSLIYDTQRFEIEYDVTDNAQYNDAVDVYSFGVIMWECGLCQRIYDKMDMKQIRDMVCEGRRMNTPSYKKCRKKDNGFNNISKSVYDAFIELINDCWAQSPIDRPTFYDIESRLELIKNLHDMKQNQFKGK